MLDLRLVILGLFATGAVACTTSPTGGTVDAAPAETFDLRFKWVDAFPAYYQTELALVSNSALVTLSAGTSWSPAELDAADGAAHAYVFAPLGGGPAVGSRALTGTATTAATALAALPPASVVMSLDVTSDAYVAIVDTPAATSADGQLELDPLAPDADVAGFIATLAATGYLVTALGFDGTHVIVASSQLASAATYDVRTATATTATLAAQATAVAAAGYTITAVGRTSAADDYLVVGTRAAGGSGPLTAVDAPAFDANVNYLAEGYAAIALYTVADAPHVIWQK